MNKVLIIVLLLFYNFVFAQTEQSIETVIQTGHYDAVTAVAYSHDGKFAVTGSADKTIKLWDIETGKELRRFKPVPRDITMQNKFFFIPTESISLYQINKLVKESKIDYKIKKALKYLNILDYRIERNRQLQQQMEY